VFQVDHPVDATTPPALSPEQSPIEAEPAPTPPPATRGKYARSGMTDAARDLIGQRLLRRMQEHHDYLDSDLTLNVLAERIGSLPHLVSQYLNDVLKTSFFDYVNGYRVAAVERKMVGPATRDMTLLDMALASGFSSKSTFNAAFKRVHGMSPSAWRSARPEPATSANS
jgi:AraC-like DNA-binding protein